MQDTGELTSIAFQRVYSFTSSAGESSVIIILPSTQNRWELFLYEWTTTKGTFQIVMGVSLSLGFRICFIFVSMFVCRFLCLFSFLLVYLFVTIIYLVSWLLVFCMFLFSFLFIRLPVFFVCLFFLFFNLFLSLLSWRCIFFFRPILS